jgi:hypothetical protein
MYVHHDNMVHLLLIYVVACSNREVVTADNRQQRGPKIFERAPVSRQKAADSREQTACTRQQRKGSRKKDLYVHKSEVVYMLCILVVARPNREVYVP